MPSIQCFVCASDDGTFLDILAESKEYCHNIETCLSLKVPKTHISTSKLCHKCAYELEQCSKFVANYTKTKQRGNGNLYKKQGCCCICMEPGKKGKIFDLWDENPMNKCVEKIQKLFNSSLLPGDTCTLSICLDCRYNLDVLFDLKRLAEKPYKFSELTKMKTSVVNRKTAICRRPKLSNSSDSETEMAPPAPVKSAKSQKSTRPAILSKATSVKPPRKLPSPAKAESSEKIESDAPAPQVNSNSPVKSGRECEACHEEIPMESATYKFNITGQRVCQKCWKATDLTSELPSKKNRKLKIAASVETKPCTVLIKDIKLFPDEVQAALFKNPAKKIRKSEKSPNGNETKEISDADTTSDDCQSLRKRALQLRGPKKRKNSDEYTLSLRKIAMEVNAATPRETRASSVQAMPSTSRRQKSYDQSYSDDTNRMKYTPKRRGRPRKYPTPPSTPVRTKRRAPVSKSASEDDKPHMPRVLKRSRIESSSTESSDAVVSRRSKKSHNDEIIVDSESGLNERYACNICKNEYDTKMRLLTHELTHSKKPSLMLKKLSISGDTDDYEKSSEMSFTTRAEILREDEPNASDMSPLTDSNTAESSMEVSSPGTAGESTTQSNIMKQSSANDSDGPSSPDKMLHSPKNSSDETIDVVASDPEYPLERIKRNLQESMDKGIKIMDVDTETETDIDVEYVKSDEEKAVNMDKSVKDNSNIVTDDATEIDSDQSTTILDDETKDRNEILDNSKDHSEEDADDSIKPAQSDSKENVEELPLTVPKEDAEEEEAQMPNGTLEPTEVAEPDEPETDFATGPLERTDSVGSVEYPEFKLIRTDSDDVTEKKTEGEEKEEKNGDINQDLDKTLIINEPDKTSEIIENHGETTAPEVSEPPQSEDKISEVNDQSENVTDQVDNSTKSVESPVHENV